MFIFVFLILFFTVPLNALMYEIKKGDSLWEISSKYKVSISMVRKLNDLYDDQLYAGQKLFIPDKIEDYTVAIGDTYEAIAKTFQIPVKYIILMNNISENQPIPGQKIKIPQNVGSISFNTTSVGNNKNKIVPVKTERIFYKVRKGDTLSDIALKYKTTIPKLRQLNNKSGNSIYVGEKLVIGTRSVSLSQKSQGNLIKHNVRSGETIGAIAYKYRVSIQDIRLWNKKNSNTIYKGETLKIYSDKGISVNSQAKNTYRTIKYTVRRGDNLSLIAAKFKVSPAQLKSWNQKSSNTIKIGETLKIRIQGMNPVQNSSTKSGSIGQIQQKIRKISYTVRRGDTLDDIALKYKVSRSKILTWNRKQSTRINIGEKLTVYIPITEQASKITPKDPTKSKKAEFIQRKTATGVKSNSFKDIPLPVKFSQLSKSIPSGRGVDIELKSQSKIVAPVKALVQYAGYINALQNVVILQLPENRTLVYAGLGTLNVKGGQTVSKGDLLGVAGINTLEKKPKIYLELRESNKVINAFHTYKILDRIKI